MVDKHIRFLRRFLLCIDGCAKFDHAYTLDIIGRHDEYRMMWHLMLPFCTFTVRHSGTHILGCLTPKHFLKWPKVI